MISKREHRKISENTKVNSGWATRGRKYFKCTATNGTHLGSNDLNREDLEQINIRTGTGKNK